MFSPLSRYHSIERAEYVPSPGAAAIVHVRRRFIPPSARALPFARHVVQGGDRLDVITARYLGDPEQFWRIADANEAMRPEALTDEVGRVLRIPVPALG